MNLYLLPNYYGNRNRRLPRKGRTINLRIAARETSKASTRREDQPAAGHGACGPEPKATSLRHALWNATTDGKSSEKDHERRSAVRIGATTEGTQESRWNRRHRRRKPL